MSTADISPAVTPSLQRKTLASSGYKSQRMYCTEGREGKDDIERKKPGRQRRGGKQREDSEERKENREWETNERQKKG